MQGQLLHERYTVYCGTGGWVARLASDAVDNSLGDYIGDYITVSAARAIEIAHHDCEANAIWEFQHGGD